MLLLFWADSFNSSSRRRLYVRCRDDEEEAGAGVEAEAEAEGVVVVDDVDAAIGFGNNSAKAGAFSLDSLPFLTAPRERRSDMPRSARAAERGIRERELSRERGWCFLSATKGVANFFCSTSFFEKKKKKKKKLHHSGTAAAHFSLSFLSSSLLPSPRALSPFLEVLLVTLSHARTTRPPSLFCLSPSLSLSSFLFLCLSRKREENKKNKKMSAAVMQENVAPAAEVQAEEMECGPMPIEKLQVCLSEGRWSGTRRMV